MRDLLHSDDEEVVGRFLDMNNLGKQGIFVVRMKNTLATTVRSQEKVEYKVCMCGDLCIQRDARVPFVTNATYL